MQQSLGKKRGRGQKFVVYSDVIFTMLNLFLFLYFGSRRNECNGLWEGKGGKARNLLLAQKVYRSEDQVLSLTNSKEKGHCHFPKNKVVTFIYNDKFTMYSDSCDIILSSLTTSRRQYQNKPQPSDFSPLIPPKKLLNSFMWSQHTENKKNRPLQL